MERLSQWIYNTLGISQSFQYKIVTTLIVILTIYLVRRIFVHFLLKSKSDLKVRYNWEKTFSYIGYFFIVVIIAPVWIKELESFGTFLGLMTAGLAIALKASARI